MLDLILRETATDSRKDCVAAIVRCLHGRSDLRDTNRGRFASPFAGVLGFVPRDSRNGCTRGSAARNPLLAPRSSLWRGIPPGARIPGLQLRRTAVLPMGGILFSPSPCAT